MKVKEANWVHIFYLKVWLEKNPALGQLKLTWPLLYPKLPFKSCQAVPGLQFVIVFDNGFL